jgi:hypothetical protein
MILLFHLVGYLHTYVENNAWNHEPKNKYCIRMHSHAFDTSYIEFCDNSELPSNKFPVKDCKEKTLCSLPYYSVYSKTAVM